MSLTIQKTKHERTVTLVEQNKDNGSTEEYPIFREQTKERIVPCCFRSKCGMNYLKSQRRGKRKRKKLSNGRENCEKKKQRSPSLVTISDTSLLNNNEYENISSDSLSSTPQEFDVVLQSTRRRMRTSNSEWRLSPHKSTLINNDLDVEENLSIHSIETLVLQADCKEHEDLKVKTEPCSSTMIPDKLFNKPIDLNNFKLKH